MRSPTRGFTICFLAAFAVLTNAVAEEQKKTSIGNTFPVNVPYAARVAVPIHFAAQDYTGPYDPADPKGIGAAARRHLKVQGQKRAEVVKSYIPPGLDKLAKTELVHLAIGEGKRFAIAHPKETAELVGIATRVKNLASAAERKVKKADDDQGSKKHERH